MKMRVFIATSAAAVSAAILAVGCGGRSGQDMVPDWAEGVPQRTISVTDSIGVELGDSNYVFGQIAAVDWTPDGSIAVLDLKRCVILIYDSEGNYQRTIGHPGSGPGEFLLPSAMTFRESDGSLAVADAMAAKIQLFDSTGAPTGQIEGFFPTVPIQIMAVDSASIVGMKPEFEQNEDGMFMGFLLARWEGTDIEPSVVYRSEMSPFDPTNIAESMKGLFFSDVAADGRVFLAPMSSEEYLVEGYEPDGTLFLTIERPYDPVPKTEEEIAEETAFVEERMTASGTPPEMIAWEPEPFKASIGSIMVAPDDRIWVRRGWVNEVVFDVFDLGGNLVETVTVDYPGDTEYWSVTAGEEGFLAFDSNPDNWSRVFMLE